MKIALFTNNTASIFRSANYCSQFILSLLHSSGHELLEIEVSEETLSKEQDENIASFKPEIFLFPDHRVKIETLVKSLTLTKAQKILIFAYGHYYELANKVSLMNKNSYFFTTGLSSLKQIEFVTSSKALEFPPIINASSFYFSQNLRESKRQELGLAKQDRLFIYAGRVSPQKNITVLIHLFEKLIELSPHFKLLIVGEIDALGELHFGIKENLNFQQILEEQLESLKPIVRENITLIRKNLPQEDINQLYNAADTFISLSTYHGEIMGMAPLEAKLTGLPCITTKWGGYKDFSSFFLEDSNLIPLDKKNSKPLLKTCFKQVLNSEINSLSKRKELSTLNLKKWDETRHLESLEYILKKPPLNVANNTQNLKIENFKLSDKENVSENYYKVFESFHD